jgi:hypothetical protein
MTGKLVWANNQITVEAQHYQQKLCANSERENKKVVI